MRKSRNFALLILSLFFVLSACSPNKVIEEAPEPVRKPLELAHEAAAEGNGLFEDELFENAILAFENAIKLFEESAATATDADSVSANIERMQLNIAKCHTDIALEHIGLTLYEDALAEYELALEIYESIEPVVTPEEEIKEMIMGSYGNITYVAELVGDHEKTLLYYDKILEENPNDGEILNNKFVLLRDKIKDEDAAFAVLENYVTVAEGANAYSAYIMLADGYAQNNRFEDAEGAYLEAEKIRSDAQTFIRIANFYRANSEWAKANTYLEKFLLTGPADDERVNVYKQIGGNYAQLGVKAKTVEYYERILEIAPEAPIALYLASHYNGLKNWNKVIQNATVVLNIDSNNVDARMLRGIAYYSLKNMNAAKADLQRLENDPKYGTQASNILKAIK